MISSRTFQNLAAAAAMPCTLALPISRTFLRVLGSTQPRSILRDFRSETLLEIARTAPEGFQKGFRTDPEPKSRTLDARSSGSILATEVQDILSGSKQCHIQQQKNGS